MMLVLATYRVLPGKLDEVSELVAELARCSREEEGCLGYVVARSREQERTIALVERYDDEAAFRAHVSSPHYLRLGKEAIHPLLESREVGFYEPFAEDGSAGSPR